MSQAEFATTFISLLITMVLWIVAWAVAIDPTRTWVMRNDCFLLRDRLFAAYQDAGVQHDAAYHYLRSLINGVIRGAGKLDTVAFLRPRVSAPTQAMPLPESSKVREVVEEIHSKLMGRLVRYLLVEHPMSWPIIVGVGLKVAWRVACVVVRRGAPGTHAPSIGEALSETKAVRRFTATAALQAQIAA